MKITLLIGIILLVLLIGCTSGAEIAEIAKASPEFQAFLSEHPNTDSQVRLLSSSAIEKDNDFLTYCEDVNVSSYYKVTITDAESGARALAFVDRNDGVVCAYSEEGVSEGAGGSETDSGDTNSQSATCKEDWSCEDWLPEECPENEAQIRVCVDAAECGTTNDIPDVKRTCDYDSTCTEDWECTAFSSCINGTMTRTCTVRSTCKTTSEKPSESAICTDSSVEEFSYRIENENLYFNDSKGVERKVPLVIGPFGNGDRTIEIAGKEFTIDVTETKFEYYDKKIADTSTTTESPSIANIVNKNLTESKLNFDFSEYEDFSTIEYYGLADNTTGDYWLVLTKQVINLSGMTNSPYISLEETIISPSTQYFYYYMPDKDEMATLTGLEPLTVPGDVDYQYNSKWKIFDGESLEEVIINNKTGNLCVENWDCSNWSACADETQSKTCTDSSVCGTTNNKPTETQDCTIPEFSVTVENKDLSFEDSQGIQRTIPITIGPFSSGDRELTIAGEVFSIDVNEDMFRYWDGDYGAIPVEDRTDPGTIISVVDEDITATTLNFELQYSADLTTINYYGLASLVNGDYMLILASQKFNFNTGPPNAYIDFKGTGINAEPNILFNYYLPDTDEIPALYGNLTTPYPIGYYSDSYEYTSNFEVSNGGTATTIIVNNESGNSI